MNRRALEFNGMAFEHEIARQLSNRYSDAKILTNRSLYSAYLKKDTQIDVIMLHQKGIFVIEAKSWRQWISGNYGDIYWKGQGSGTDCITAFNPINQNIIHIRSLRNAIRTQFTVDVETFENVVCLPDGVVIDSKCHEVCNLSLLGFLVDSIMQKHGYDIRVSDYEKYIESVTY